MSNGFLWVFIVRELIDAVLRVLDRVTGPEVQPVREQVALLNQKLNEIEVA